MKPYPHVYSATATGAIQGAVTVANSLQGERVLEVTVVAEAA